MMIKTNRLINKHVLSLFFMGFLAMNVLGQGVGFKPVADEMIGGNSITWVTKINYAKLVLTISRPDGTVFRKSFPSGNSPYVDIASILGDSHAEGTFFYELRVIPAVSSRVRVEDSDGAPSREARRENVLPVNDLTQSGAFSITNGYIVNSSMQETPARTLLQDPGPLDQVIADDLIVQGSACVGLDCVNNESFGFDTIRMKENNIRIKFDDTSASAGFPANDWQLTANDSASGGASKFSIEDITGAKVPFTLTAGAPSNSLFVSSTGRLGLKTATPVLDIHIVNGNTPALRFEQDGTVGYSPQTWDVAGNEANFFIRDVTGGSRLPFRIQPGALTNSLTLRADGKVGIGTWSPTFALEVSKTGSTANFACIQTDGATGIVSADSSHVFIGAKSNHDFRLIANDSPKITILPSGNVGFGVNAPANPIQMASGAFCSAGGTWTNASSRELKENIQSLTTTEAFNTLNHLSPVKYNYKVDKMDKHVGFIAEDAPALVATQDKKGMSPMDVVAVLTKVVQEQQKSLQEQGRTIAELQKKIAAMEKK